MVESLRSQKLAQHPVWPAPGQIQATLSGGDVSRMLAEPPFVPPPGADQRKWNYWMMSQRAGTLSYLTFSAGFSLAVYLLFHIVCDWGGLQLPFFRTLGTNSLAAYVLHGMVGSAVEPFIPKDAPGWYVVTGLLVFFWITWSFVRTFEKQGFYLRV